VTGGARRETSVEIQLDRWCRQDLMEVAAGDRVMGGAAGGHDQRNVNKTWCYRVSTHDVITIHSWVTACVASLGGGCGVAGNCKAIVQLMAREAG
jgi:hypothetical protein